MLKRAGDLQSEQSCGVGHAIVVGHDRLEVVADGERGGKVDGVKGAEDARLEDAGRIEDPVVDADEVDPTEAIPYSGEDVRAEVPDRPHRLGAHDG